MTWVGVTLGAVVAIAVLLLAIPVRLSLDVERTDRLRMRWRFRWLFGLVDVQSGQRPKEPREGASAEKPGRRRRTPSRRGPAAFWAVVRTPGLVRRVAHLLPNLLRTVTWEQFSLRAEFGCEDPADTGQVYGLVSPLLVASRVSGWPISCQPTFERACLEGACSAAWRVRPISVARVGLAFILSPEALRALWRWLAARRR